MKFSRSAQSYPALFIATALCALMHPASVHAQGVTFVAEDAGASALVTTSTTPGATNPYGEDLLWNTDAAAIGTVQNVRFTNTTVRTTAYQLLTSDTGNVTVSDEQEGTTSHSGGLYVNNDLNGAGTTGVGTTYGYSTPGSANFLQEAPSRTGTTQYVTFTFTKPVDSFGAYFTGTQADLGTETLVYSDGTQYSLTIPENDDGGVGFAGLTYAGKSISYVEIKDVNLTNEIDHFGVSGIEIGVLAPEPSSIAAFIIGILLLAAYIGLGRKRIGSSSQA
jgi:hypothetical protein